MEPLPAASPEQAAVLDSWSGPLLVLGGPGTGKTALAGLAALRELRAGRAPLVFTRTRDGASRLRNAISASLPGKVWQPQVTTLHAFAWAVFQRFQDQERLWRLLSAPEQEFRVRELLAADAGLWPEELRAAVGTSAFTRRVRAVLQQARQLGLDPEDVREIGQREGKGEWVAMGEFFARYLDVLDAEFVLDYAECTHRARLLLAGPEVRAALAAQIGSVVADDLTEADPAQLGLLHDLSQVCGRVLATANPDAAVSGFRGAHPRAAQVFAQIFTFPDGRPAQVAELHTGWRATPAVAEALASLRSRIARPVLAGKTWALQPRPAHAGGRVAAFEFSNTTVEADELARMLLSARARGVRFGQMAVLSRSMGAAGLLVRTLSAWGVPTRVPAGEIPLAQAPAVKPLLQVMEALLAGNTWASLAQALLTAELCGLDDVELRGIVRGYRLAAGTGDTTASSAELLAEALNHPSWIGSAPHNAVFAKLRRFLKLLEEAAALLQAGAAPDRVAWVFWDGSPWQDRLLRAASRPDLAGMLANRDLDALVEFFAFAGQMRRGGAGGLRDLLNEIAAQQIPADNAREDRADADAVAILTVHRARGRQWRLVAIPSLQEGIWPNLRRPAALLSPQSLSPDGLAGPATAAETLLAERRLLYAACGCASEELLLTCALGGPDGEQQPSRFFAELGVVAEPQSASPAFAGLPGLVGELRFQAQESFPEVREGAQITLAMLARARDRFGELRVPWAHPENWWGVLDSTDKIEVVQAPEAAPDNPDDAGGESAQPAIVLSPSAVGTLLECPRRYFLSRRAAAERPGSQSLVLGTLMHSLLEQAQLERMSALPPPAGQPGFFADLELRAVGELRRRWGELEYPVRWQSAAKLSQAEAMLRRYFAWEQRSAAAGVEIEAVERPFELTLELFGVVVALPGKIDRVEIAGGKRRVVDFKTGQPLLQAEVAASDQLGIYQLALARDTGPTAVAGAGMVFLGKQNKEGLPVEYGQAGLAVLPKRFVLPPAVLLADPPPELRRELRARAEGAEEEPQIAGPFNWVELRAMLAAVVVAQGSYPAVENAKCGRCPFRDSCPIRDEGEQLC